MEHFPKVSIGLPVFNGENYLRLALESLVKQTYRDLELIIADNASSDGTEAICLEYADRDARIRYFRHSENLGSLKNYLFTFQHAKGEFFMWAAHDDLWERDWVEKLLASASAEAGTMAYGQVRTINDAGMLVLHPANERLFQFDQKKSWLRRMMYFLEYEGLGKANPIYGLYRRSDVEKGFAALTAGSTYADCLFLFDVLSGVRLKSVSGTFHYKRVHTGSLANALPAHVQPNGRLCPGFRKVRHLMRSMFNADATTGYISRTVGRERLLMRAAGPLKVLYSCYGVILTYLSARRAAQTKAIV